MDDPVRYYIGCSICGKADCDCPPMTHNPFPEDELERNRILFTGIFNFKARLDGDGYLFSDQSDTALVQLIIEAVRDENYERGEQLKRELIARGTWDEVKWLVDRR